jgi:hypothetical protein
MVIPSLLTFLHLSSEYEEVDVLLRTTVCYIKLFGGLYFTIRAFSRLKAFASEFV